MRYVRGIVMTTSTKSIYMFPFKGIKSELKMRSEELSDDEIKADILNRLLRRGCWGAKYMPKETFVNWLAKRVKRNGKRIKRLMRELIQNRYLLVHKKGETVSLNPAKSMEIVQYIERILKF